MSDSTQPKPTISYDDFARLDLRVATVTEAREHPNADKLLILRVDLGGESRQIIAGIRGHYEPADLVGRQIVVLANLAPRKMRGETSEGMLLAACTPDFSQIVLIQPDRPIAAGSPVS